MIGRLLQHVHNIPPELRALSQWCISMPDKSPAYTDAKGLHHASSTNSDTWMTFEDACAAASWLNQPGSTDIIHETLRDMDWQGQQGEFGIGFMFSEYDPYAVIDLDVKNASNCDDPEKYTPPEAIQMYQEIVEYFDSYTERSPSGIGLHVIVRGVVGPGARRDGVEVYDRWRFMRCTGDIVVPKIPADGVQDRLDTLLKHVREGRQDRSVDLVEGLEQRYEDRELFEIASTADNGNKFMLLWQYQGEPFPWEGFPSQSEADLALMSMFTFYSDNNAQCRRLFRMSGLGKREKATKDDRHLNLMLRLIRARQMKQHLLDAQIAEMALANAQAHASPLATPAPLNETPVPNRSENIRDLTYTDPAALAPEEGLMWPPGFAGDIAKSMYRISMRPVPEVSIVAAIGLLAGVCGKAYNIPQSGLNMYVTLVARSGVGKEGMHSGVSAMMRAICDQVPAAMQLVTFDEFASGQALVKRVGENPCFLQVSGEWGRHLKRMANDERDAAMMSLRTTMTNVYQKSAHGSIVGGITYSNKDNNTAAVNGVAYSMIGESTPGTFYETLTQSMMEDGFMSRLLVIEYEGDRPTLNRNGEAIAGWVRDRFAQIAGQALTIMSNHTVQMVEFDARAERILDDFNLLCDRRINETDNESRRQMWNRAHLKVLRLAALLAVADNHLTPVVSEAHAAWALMVVERDVELITRKLKDGDIGSGDTVQQTKVASLLAKYLDPHTTLSKTANKDMQRDGVVPRSLIFNRVSRQAAFYKHARGTNTALNDTLRAMEDNGYIVEVSKRELMEKYKYAGKAFRIVHLPNFDD